MNRSIIFLFLSFFFFLSFKTIFAQSEATQTLINKCIVNLPENTELSIGIIENGKIERLGYQIKNGKLTAVENSDAIFEIGSITKTFTAALIMEQIEKGNMFLDDPIQKYLPIKMARDSYDGHSISIKHLMMHTNGLSNGPPSFTLPYLKAKIFTPKNPNRNFKAKHYYCYLKKFKLDYVPGEKWDYNNAGYGLPGEFIKNQKKSSWEEVTQKNIFDHLDMNDTYFSIGKKEKDRLVEGITSKDKKAKPWEMDFINPAGAIKSTLNDMLKYAAAQLNPPNKQTSFLQATHDPLEYGIKLPEGKLWDGNSMGLGWWHNLEQKENKFIWHGGASGGYTAFVGFSKEKNRAVVVLSNISSSHPQSRAENRIPKPILLGHELMRME